MDFLTDFSKLFGRKIISYFIWLYVYCFLFSLESNIFVCSYIQTIFLSIENKFYLLFIGFIFFVIYSYKFKLSNNKNKIFNYINFNYVFYCLKYLSIFNYLNMLFNRLNLHFVNFVSLYNNNLLFIAINYCYSIFKNNILVWYPIYKSYSIFGFYKSTRLKFVDLKNENLKRFKY